jgi:hypothetical protein
MNATDLILKLQSSHRPEDIFTRRNFKKEYLAYIKLLHPDICSEPGASDATSKLNDLREVMESRFLLQDDAGAIRVADEKTLLFQGDKTLLNKSLQQYRRLMAFKDDAALHFQKYLPASMEWQGDALCVRSAHTMVPLSGLQLPREHVSWVTSRLLEWVSWLHQVGYSHNGINPESVCLVPESHGIVITSFYHLAPLNSKLSTISGAYLPWYAPSVFDQKKAVSGIDLGLLQRTALYLLGDPSGHGVKLKMTEPAPLIDFLIASHTDAVPTYEQYRTMLRTVFGKPVFHHLNL